MKSTKKNFKVTVSANGITVTNGTGKVAFKMVDGKPVRQHENVEGKDHTYGMNLTKFMEGSIVTPKVPALKKMTVTERINKIAEVIKDVADSPSFRNLSSRVRKHAEDLKLNKKEIFFYEQCQGIKELA